jgi:hypothetical protein
MTDRIDVTPAMLKAAWLVARNAWPSRVVERGKPCTCSNPKRLVVLETSLHVEEPTPAFCEAIKAALAAGGYL